MLGRRKEPSEWVSLQQKLLRGEEKRETTDMGQQCLGLVLAYQ